jgi:hypothetical protein
VLVDVRRLHKKVDLSPCGKEGMTRRTGFCTASGFFAHH